MSSRRAIWMIPSDQVKALFDYTELQAHRLEKNPELAEEAVAQVLEKLSCLEVWPDHEKAWIQTALKNALIDRARKDDRANQADVPILRNEKDPHAESADLNEFFNRIASYQRTSHMVFLTELWRKLSYELSEKEFKLLLAVKNGYSHDQIATQLKYANAASVTQTLSRIRKKIRPILEAWEYRFLD